MLTPAFLSFSDFDWRARDVRRFEQRADFGFHPRQVFWLVRPSAKLIIPIRGYVNSRNINTPHPDTLPYRVTVLRKRIVMAEPESIPTLGMILGRTPDLKAGRAGFNEIGGLASHVSTLRIEVGCRIKQEMPEIGIRQQSGRHQVLQNLLHVVVRSS